MKVRGIVHTMIIMTMCQSCVEEIQPVKFTAEEPYLVVDARISDRPVQQKVLLSRTFQFNEEPVFETKAQVYITGSNGARFNFIEQEQGSYYSETELNLIETESYQLHIVLSNGESFVSNPEFLPQKVEIENINPVRELNNFDEEGVSIYVSSISQPGSPSFFRYEYEESYKIIAPKWDPFEFEVIRYEPCFPNPFVVGLKTREIEQRICYSSNLSTDLILASTADQTENEINKNIRFIKRDNYIISHRYSILVHQYAQSLEAYTFYAQLEDFSSSELLFSQVQPGFIAGNISSTMNSSDEAIGFFEISSYSSKRIFFNYEDLFPGEDLPPYPINCENLGTPLLWPEGYHCAAPGVCDGNCESPLIEQILAGLLVFAGERENDFRIPYYTLPRACGDCTQLGSNIKPEYWVE
ncbi:hypothetical protein GCM10011414_14900 [Croceivirga lutea]|uniref:DUF4249 domain-containing protein n=1 Tax=Croceivirga lutea TaxID=1775167 RepID=UPI00163B2965|nr:DUF4249 domain-containing protein [Croceivirga lutea]GGG46286.1 hypothetical protein GCM10011414_14900 [Croceivirga lutea]